MPNRLCGSRPLCTRISECVLQSASFCSVWVGPKARGWVQRPGGVVEMQRCVFILGDGARPRCACVGGRSVSQPHTTTVRLWACPQVKRKITGVQLGGGRGPGVACLGLARMLRAACCRNPPNTPGTHQTFHVRGCGAKGRQEPARPRQGSVQHKCINSSHSHAHAQAAHA